MYFVHVLYSGVCGNHVYFKCIVAMYNGGGVVSIHAVPHGIHILPLTCKRTVIHALTTVIHCELWPLHDVSNHLPAPFILMFMISTDSILVKTWSLGQYDT